MKKYILTALVIFLLCGSALAAAVRDLNLEELCSGAGKIFWGTCIGVEAQGPDLVYSFKARRVLKGGPADTVTLRMNRLASRYARAPRFRSGQEVVLFLHPESRLGYSSPVGFGQGIFNVSESAGSEKTVANERGNRRLFKGVNLERLFSGAGRSSPAGGGLLRHQEFMEAIRTIVEKQ